MPHCLTCKLRMVKSVSKSASCKICEPDQELERSRLYGNGAKSDVDCEMLVDNVGEDGTSHRPTSRLRIIRL